MHIFPTEFFEYERTLTILAKNLNYITGNINLYVTLNCSDSSINWSTSSKTKNFVINKFKELNKRFSKIKVELMTKEGSSEFGVNHHRRITYQKFQVVDYIIFLDSDLVFSETILKSTLDTMRNVQKNNWNIIVPQTPRLWDTTWDCNVNDYFKKDELNSYKHTDIEGIFKKFHDKPKSFFKSDIHKFAGGWFTAYSPKLLNYIGIPDSFGSYGPDDTYIMNCMNILRNKNFNVSQYVINNEIVVEQPNKNNWVNFKTSPVHLRKNANNNFFYELREFSKKL